MTTTSAAAGNPGFEPGAGFWADYKRSLKSPEVEEPVDLYVHRPLAYLVTKVLYPTSVTPNMVTGMSIVFGLIAGVSLLVEYPWHLQVAGLSIFLSAILDCADGQLARLRGTSSASGRMLDGVADFVVVGCAVGGATYWIAHKFRASPWVMLAFIALALATAVTGSFHTSLYDYFKNVFMRFTLPGLPDVEDLETARRRRAGEQSRGFWAARLAWPIYLFYLKSQENVVRRFDPYTLSCVGRIPGYDAGYAAAYRRHAGGAMRLWKSVFGFGSLVFGLALATAFDVLEYYVLARVVLQNALFYGYLRPLQRRASRDAFEEMGIDPAKLPAA